MWRNNHSPRELVQLNATRLRARGRAKTYAKNPLKLQKLPALASSMRGFESYEWTPTLRTILEGVHDDASALSSLRGKEDTLVESIFSFVASKWGDAVTLTLPAYAIGNPAVRFRPPEPDALFLKFDTGRYCQLTERPIARGVELGKLKTDEASGKPLQGLVSYVPITTIKQFPEPEDRDVNMLPFVFGDKASLPEDLQCYYDLIQQCSYQEEEIGRVGYLTVHESYVDTDATQRREGLHIEVPGAFTDEEPSTFNPGPEHRWGMGMFYGPDRLDGGIYMASTVAGTSQVWDALVDKSKRGIVDRHGGCEHLRHLLGPGKKLEANQLIWMTDCTPHEALPQTESGYRQFFRGVTPKTSHWFADHSTPSPLVPLPDSVNVVHGNKFEV